MFATKVTPLPSYLGIFASLQMHLVTLKPVSRRERETNRADWDS